MKKTDLKAIAIEAIAIVVGLAVYDGYVAPKMKVKK